MNKKTTLPPEGVGGIETIEDILAMAREAKSGRGGKRQPSGKFESA